MIINTRQDLDAIAGSPEHDQFIQYLKGSMTMRIDTQVYPVDYTEGLEPIWVDVENLEAITRFGFTKEDFV